MNCCFTGHRAIPAFRMSGLIKRLDKTINTLILEGVTCFYAGGALGFDTLAAKAVLRAKRKYPNVKLILLLPCRSQTRFWKESDTTEYEIIKKCADEVRYTSVEYTKSSMFVRNRALVDYSDVCVCYLEKDAGGTAYTVKYANLKGLRIINLAKK